MPDKSRQPYPKLDQDYYPRRPRPQLEIKPTVYPPSFPQHLKDYLARMFKILATAGAKARLQLADEIFASNAHWITALKIFEGRDDILRGDTELRSTKTLHEYYLHNVYSNDVSFRDLMCSGHQRTIYEDGREVISDFASRLVFDDPTLMSPRLLLLQDYYDAAWFGPIKEWVEDLKDKTQGKKKQSPMQCVVS